MRRRSRTRGGWQRRRWPVAPVYVVMTLICAVVAGVVGWLLVTRTGLRPLWAYLAAVNIVTFLNYAYDKSVSGRRHSRVPEGVLHLLALAGGSPAALLAQLMLRHKTLKRSFQIRFWLSVVLQLIAVGVWWWLHRRTA